MKASTHDFVTVDMRGLKAALVARALAERVSVSVVVRRAVKRELGLVDAPLEPSAEDKAAVLTASTVKVSLRLTGAEAERLTSGARRAGLSRGAFLAVCWPASRRWRVARRAVRTAWLHSMRRAPSSRP